MRSPHSPPCKPTTPLGWRACRSTCRRVPPRRLCRRSSNSTLANYRRSTRLAASAATEQRDGPHRHRVTSNARGRQARSIPLPRVDAGVKERNEMTIGRTDDPENPVSVTASRSRRTVWDWIANPIWASGHAPRQQAEHMNAVDHPSEFSQTLLNPRGRPHMNAVDHPSEFSQTLLNPRGRPHMNAVDHPSEFSQTL